MNKCKTCKFAIFDETWGEYKCSKYKHYIYNLEEYADCGSYKEKRGKKDE